MGRYEVRTDVGKSPEAGQHRNSRPTVEALRPMIRPTTTRCAGFIKPRHLNVLVQVELIILRSHCGNSGLSRRCTWRVNLGPLRHGMFHSRIAHDFERSDAG